MAHVADQKTSSRQANILKKRMGTRNREIVESVRGTLETYPLVMRKAEDYQRLSVD